MELICELNQIPYCSDSDSDSDSDYDSDSDEEITQTKKELLEDYLRLLYGRGKLQKINDDLRETKDYWFDKYMEYKKLYDKELFCRGLMSSIDENKHIMREGHYIEMCNLIKEMRNDPRC